MTIVFASCLSYQVFSCSAGQASTFQLLQIVAKDFSSRRGMSGRSSQGRRCRRRPRPQPRMGGQKSFRATPRQRPRRQMASTDRSTALPPCCPSARALPPLRCWANPPSRRRRRPRSRRGCMRRWAAIPFFLSGQAVSSDLLWFVMLWS